MNFDRLPRPSLEQIKRYRPLILIAVGICVVIGIGTCRERRIRRDTPAMDTPFDYWVSVLLQSGAEQFDLTGHSAVIISDIEAGQKKRLEPSDQPIRVSYDQDFFFADEKFSSASMIMIVTEAPNVLGINGDEYRGDIRLYADRQDNTFSIVNHLPIEPYLAGVISAEMPQHWEMHALRAQTVAARTYALYIKRRFGINRYYDLRSTQASQVYRGVAAETARTWEAVTSTEGKFLQYSDGQNSEIFTTFYSSACGGHTESSEYVFGEALRPLSGVRCVWCAKVARDSVIYWGPAEFDKQYVSQRLIERYPALQPLEQITHIEPGRVSHYEDFTRVTSFQLTGINGKSHQLRAEDFRLSVDPSGRRIRSTAFTISETEDTWIFSDGRGFGHGVGLCQYGAEGMARRGHSFEQILEHYYPDSEIITKY